MEISNLNGSLNNGYNNNVAVSQQPILKLAYIGDAVFELCVRSKICSENNTSINALNSKSRNFVKATAQAKMYYKVKEFLNDEEQAVLRRGRNAKSSTMAKNASVIDYRHATGLEALFGYLFLTGNNERLLEVFKICTEE